MLQPVAAGLIPVVKHVERLAAQHRSKQMVRRWHHRPNSHQYRVYGVYVVRRAKIIYRGDVGSRKCLRPHLPTRGCSLDICGGKVLLPGRVEIIRLYDSRFSLAGFYSRSVHRD